MGCDKRVYTLRGWLAFVAFLDIAQALRCWLDKDTFLGSFMCASPTNCTEEQKGLHNNNPLCIVVQTFFQIAVPVPSSTARLLFAFSLENALILLVCAFCIHHWP